MAVVLAARPALTLAFDELRMVRFSNAGPVFSRARPRRRAAFHSFLFLQRAHGLRRRLSALLTQVVAEPVKLAPLASPPAGTSIAR